MSRSTTAPRKATPIDPRSKLSSTEWSPVASPHRAPPMTAPSTPTMIVPKQPRLGACVTHWAKAPAIRPTKIHPRMLIARTYPPWTGAGRRRAGAAAERHGSRCLAVGTAAGGAPPGPPARGGRPPRHGAGQGWGRPGGRWRPVGPAGGRRGGRPRRPGGERGRLQPRHEGGPGLGDALAPHRTGALVEPPGDRGVDEGELLGHGDIIPRGCDSFGGWAGGRPILPEVSWSHRGARHQQRPG